MFHIYEFIVGPFLPTIFLTREDRFPLLIHRTVFSAIKFDHKICCWSTAAKFSSAAVSTKGIFILTICLYCQQLRVDTVTLGWKVFLPV